MEHAHALVERAAAHVRTSQFHEGQPEFRDDPPGMGQFCDRALALGLPEYALADERIDQLDKILVAAGGLPTVLRAQFRIPLGERCDFR